MSKKRKEGGDYMKIEGAPKEIVDLILRLQGQLKMEFSPERVNSIIQKSKDDISRG